MHETNMALVLIVEDDPDIVQIVKTYLEKDGFSVGVARDGLTGLTKALEVNTYFTRFYRADKARSESGSGIGLTIARYFVEAQGGMMGVSSKLGEGTHFYFTLPLVPKVWGHEVVAKPQLAS
jgi:signal transduction histidine kinase